MMVSQCKITKDRSFGACLYFIPVKSLLISASSRAWPHSRKIPEDFKGQFDCRWAGYSCRQCPAAQCLGAQSCCPSIANKVLSVRVRAGEGRPVVPQSHRQISYGSASFACICIFRFPPWRLPLLCSHLGQLNLGLDLASHLHLYCLTGSLRCISV